jgi:cytochrome b pre-mRNA-processing protein 3
MIWTRFRRQPRRDTIAALYGTIVAQARSPSFYRDFGVSDTVNGRFDMIVLHLAVFLHRLKTAGADQVALGQPLFDTFCSDMDGNLREMGISDLKVPKEMRRMGEAFYGRIKVYDEALSSDGEAALVEAIGRNIYGDGNAAEAPRLAAYVRAAVQSLTAQDASSFERTGVRFPDPANVAA